MENDLEMTYGLLEKSESDDAWEIQIKSAIKSDIMLYFRRNQIEDTIARIYTQ